MGEAFQKGEQIGHGAFWKGTHSSQNTVFQIGTAISGGRSLGTRVKETSLLLYTPQRISGKAVS